MTKAQGTKVKKLLREACIVRDGERCLRCGRTGIVLHLSHVKSEGAWPRLKYELDNVKLLCMQHHLYWWHKDITEAAEWFRKTFPERDKTLKKMVRNYYTLPKPNYEHLVEKITSYIGHEKDKAN